MFKYKVVPQAVGNYFYWNHLAEDYEVCHVRNKSGRWIAFFPDGRRQDWCHTADFFYGPIQAPARPSIRLSATPLTEAGAAREFQLLYQEQRRDERIVGVDVTPRNQVWDLFIRKKIALGEALPEARVWPCPPQLDRAAAA